MPLSKKTLSAGGQQLAGPGIFIGPTHHTRTLLIDVSGLTTDEVDADGYLKAGTPFITGGVLVSAPAQEILGVVVEPTKVADSNAAGDLTAATDIDVALATIGQINRAAAEDELGRAYTADEVSAFAASQALVLVE